MLPVGTRAAILLAVGAALGALSNTIGPRRIPWVPGGVAEAIAEAGTGDILTGGVEILSRTGTGLLLDARLEHDFLAGHIPGALSFPLPHFEEKTGELLPRIVQAKAEGRTIVVYCEGGDCESSKGLREKLREAFEVEALLSAGGFEIWSASGKPIEQGAGGPR